MFLALSKRLRPNLPSFTRFCSASATQNPDLKLNPPRFNVVDYLINSCAVSPEKASRISKPISHLKSPQNPDAALRFLKHQGFTEANIKILIALNPTLLCCPQKSLDINLRALRDIGLSPSTLTQIILSNPAALQLRSAVPRIMFWRNFLGDDEAALIKAFKHTLNLVGLDITQSIAPKLSFLQSHGLSPQDVQRIVLNVPRFITSSVQVMEDLLKRTKELGFQPESKMFVYGLAAMVHVSPELLQRKMELLKSFGWSRDDFLSALRMAPSMAWISENSLQLKMHFFVGEGGCEPTSIASNPILLKLSLEKRLRPRFHVLQRLESKGLSGRRQSFKSAMMVSENKFVEKYILPHKEEVSGLHEAYLAACA